jgi:hypothetical protein
MLGGKDRSMIVREILDFLYTYVLTAWYFYAALVVIVLAIAVLTRRTKPSIASSIPVLGDHVSTVPFFIADIWQGLAKGHGLVALHQEAIRLEVQIVDSLTGLIKFRHQIVEVPIRDVASIAIRSYLFGTYTLLWLQGTRMDTFQSFPRLRGGRCRLRIARRDRQNCAAFVEHFATVKASGQVVAAA